LVKPRDAVEVVEKIVVEPGRARNLTEADRVVCHSFPLSLNEEDRGSRIEDRLTRDGIIFNPRSLIFDLRSSIFDLRSSIFHLLSSIFDPRSSLFDPRSSILDPRSSILDPRSSILDPRWISVGELRRNALFHLSPPPVFALFEQFALFNRFFDAGALIIGRNRNWRARQVTVKPDHIHRGPQMPDAARRCHPRQSRQALL